MRKVTTLVCLIGCLAVSTAQAKAETAKYSVVYVKKEICLVFKSRCGEALRVSHCESRFDTNAENGQYLGLFQMGRHERATYGHGSTPRAQALAAHRYFVASGSDWSPWTCKPWW